MPFTSHLTLIEDHKHSEQQRYTSTRQNYEYETN